MHKRDAQKKGTQMNTDEAQMNTDVGLARPSGAHIHSLRSSVGICVHLWSQESSVPLYLCGSRPRAPLSRLLQGQLFGHHAVAGAEAAIGHQHGAVDDGRGVGGEEGNDAGDIHRLGDAAERVPFE
jgi:hypothetical protein